MAEINNSALEADQNNDATVSLGMYEAGGEEGSGFHVFNAAPNQYHRAEVLQRTGAIDITCNLKQVMHGAMSPDSDRYATLMVFQWLFQPKGSRRISEATIEFLFEGSADSDIEVEDISFLNTYSLMPTTQEETVTKGLEATVGVEQFASLGLTGKWEKSVTATTSSAITLRGGKRLMNNRPPNRIAAWSLSENQSQPTGIPASLRVAILVSRNDRQKFHCKLAFTCKTDVKTTAESFFKKIPKDDPIVLQPDPRERGTRPNKSVSYDNDELGNVNLNELCDVTFRTLITDGQKIWK